MKKTILLLGGLVLLAGASLGLAACSNTATNNASGVQATNQNTVGVVDYLNKADGVFLFFINTDEITPDTNAHPHYVKNGKVTHYRNVSISLREISKMSNKEISKEIQNQIKKDYEDQVAENKQLVQDFQDYTGEQDTSEYYSLKDGAESGQKFLDGDLKSLKHYIDICTTEGKIRGSLNYDKQGNDLAYEWLYYYPDGMLLSKNSTSTDIKISKVDYVYLTDLDYPRYKTLIKAADVKGTLGMDKEGTKNVSVPDDKD